MGHAERRGGLPLGVPGAEERQSGAHIEGDARSAAVLPVSLSPPDTGKHALLDQVPFVGGEGSQQVEQQASRG